MTAKKRRNKNTTSVQHDYKSRNNDKTSMQHERKNRCKIECNIKCNMAAKKVLKGCNKKSSMRAIKGKKEGATRVPNERKKKTQEVVQQKE